MKTGLGEAFNQLPWNQGEFYAVLDEPFYLIPPSQEEDTVQEKEDDVTGLRRDRGAVRGEVRAAAVLSPELCHELYRGFPAGPGGFRSGRNAGTGNRLFRAPSPGNPELRLARLWTFGSWRTAARFVSMRSAMCSRAISDGTACTPVWTEFGIW